MLNSSGFGILQPWYRLRQHELNVTPELSELPFPHVGVCFSLKTAVAKTVTRIIQGQLTTLSADELRKTPVLRSTIKFGFDGSGSHAIFNQANNINTRNMIMSMFCPLKLADVNGKTVWEQKTPNAPKSQRPISLQMGKESIENCRALEVFNADIQSMRTDGITVVDESGNSVKVIAEI